MMPHIEGAIRIHRPVDEVFDFVADERNEPTYNPHMLHVEKVTTGSIGRGATFKATLRTGHRTTEMTIENTEYDRPGHLGSRTHLSSMDIRGRLTFEPISDGTRLRWSWDIEPHGIYKLVAPLVERQGRKQECAVWAGLKRVLEADDTFTSAVPG